MCLVPPAPPSMEDMGGEGPPGDLLRGCDPTPTWPLISVSLLDSGHATMPTFCWRHTTPL